MLKIAENNWMRNAALPYAPRRTWTGLSTCPGRCCPQFSEMENIFMLEIWLLLLVQDLHSRRLWVYVMNCNTSLLVLGLDCTGYIIFVWPLYSCTDCSLIHHVTPWRNGSASDSRSEGCVFKSRRGQWQHFVFVFLKDLTNMGYSTVTVNLVLWLQILRTGPILFPYLPWCRYRSYK